jgi:hypothetical protein
MADSRPADRNPAGGFMSRRSVRVATIAMLVASAAAVTLRGFGWTFDDVKRLAIGYISPSAVVQRSVAPEESISEALRDAPPGTDIVVEPGEYREQITLVSGVRLVSRIPGGATIRLPADVSDAADTPAVLARNVSGAALVGFNVSGDSASPLPVGIRVQNSTVSIFDVEVTGATRAAIEFAGGGTSALMASDILDNPGPALVVRDGAAPHVSHNTFARNGRSDSAGAAVIVQKAPPVFTRNVFAGMSDGSFVGLDSAAMTALKRDNWLVPTAPPRRSR